MQRSLFEEMMAVEDGRPVPMPLQVDFLERGRAEYLKGHKRVLFQAPCGSGKTVVASQQTKQALERGKRVLHIAPLRKLVDQMLAMLKRFGIDASPIMEGRQRWNSSVYCASRDTLLAILKSGSPLPPCDLFIQDECHVAAVEVQKWYLQNCPDAYWSGYTATPVKPDGSSLAPPWQGLVSMAPTSKMIELGRLVNGRIFNPDAVGKRRLKGDKTKPAGDPVAHWKRYADGLPTVVFAATVADSEALVRRYNEAGISAEHVDAHTPEEGSDDSREAIYQRSRDGKTLVISNVGILTMGVDLPWLTCCQILRGCKSLVLWMQGIGRVMRAHLGKKEFIVLDHSGAAHEYLNPAWDFNWTLADGNANVKANKPPKDRKPVCCLGCGLFFVGMACPECGRVIATKKRKSLVASLQQGDAVLTEFTGSQNAAIQGDTLDRLWNKCYHVARGKGRTMGAAAAMFSKESGMPPWKAELSATLPRGDEWKMSARDWLMQTQE